MNNRFEVKFLFPTAFLTFFVVALLFYFSFLPQLLILCASHVSSKGLYMASCCPDSTQSISPSNYWGSSWEWPCRPSFQIQPFSGQTGQPVAVYCCRFYCVFIFSAIFFAIAHFFSVQHIENSWKNPSICSTAERRLRQNHKGALVMTCTQTLAFVFAARLICCSFYCLSDDNQLSDSTLSLSQRSWLCPHPFWNPIEIGSLRQTLRGWLRCAALMSCSDGLSVFSPPH